MCNLNVFIKSNLFMNGDDDLNGFISFFNTATLNSYVNNNDGDGVYFSDDDTLKISVNKLNLIKGFEPQFKHSDFIISHQRLSTSGHKEIYTQPFKRDGFILAHNGVMGNWVKNGHSDTYNFFKKFCDTFKDIKGLRTDRIVKTIKRLLRNENGTYSIILYDTEQRTAYYFKNSGTHIKAVINKARTGLYLATNGRNTEYLDVYRDGFKEFDIKNERVYKISLTKNERINIKDLGKIPCKKDTILKNSYSSIEDFNLNSPVYEPFKEPKTITNKDLKKFKQRWGVNKNHKKSKCEICKHKTKNTSGGTGAVMCDDCLMIEYDNLKNNVNYDAYGRQSYLN